MPVERGAATRRGDGLLHGTGLVLGWFSFGCLRFDPKAYQRRPGCLHDLLGISVAFEHPQQVLGHPTIASRRPRLRQGRRAVDADSGLRDVPGMSHATDHKVRAF
jgi:hypothetical protein